MKKVTVQMTLTKSTKGTHVYNDNGSETPIPTLYIKKEALPSPPPATIKITVEFE